MGTELRAVPIADLIEDDNIYPRHKVDGSYVVDLVRAIEAGAQLPPPLVDAATMRIVDGYHRVRAHRRLDADGEIECMVRTFADESEVIAAAVEANATHGRKLDVQDKTRAALMLRKQGFDVARIAVVLHTTPARVEQLTIRVVRVGEDELPAKPVCYPERGEGPRRLSPDQYQVMRSAPGLGTAQRLTQLAAELEAGLIDADKFRLPLERLAAALDAALAQAVPA